MTVGVIDSGVAIGWLLRRPRSLAKLDGLFAAGRKGDVSLLLSVVNLTEVLRHTEDLTRATGADALAVLSASGVQLQRPDESIARRAARLTNLSLADAFATATAQEFHARLHTTDEELIRLVRRTGMSVTKY